MNKVRKIVFLPIAKNDLKAIIKYISVELQMQQAAESIYNELATSINKLAKFPLAY